MAPTIDGDEAAAIGVVEAFYAALAAGDVAAVLALADPAIVVVQSDRLPWGGRFAGAEGLASFGAGVRRLIASTVTVDRYVAAGGRIAAIGRTAGEVVATGRSFDVPLVHLFTIAAGRIAALEIIVDAREMLRALA